MNTLSDLTTQLDKLKEQHYHKLIAYHHTEKEIKSLEDDVNRIPDVKKYLKELDEDRKKEQTYVNLSRDPNNFSVMYRDKSQQSYTYDFFNHIQGTLKRSLSIIEQRIDEQQDYMKLLKEKEQHINILRKLSSDYFNEIVILQNEIEEILTKIRTGFASDNSVGTGFASDNSVGTGCVDKN